jgi:hypothetical protein
VNFPAATDINGITDNWTVDPVMRYDVLNRGNRNSIRVDEDDFFSGQGDCYGGGISAPEWCVYNQVSGSQSITTIQAVIDGLLVRQYST